MSDTHPSMELLIQRHLADELDAREYEIFDAALRSDPDLRRRLLEEAALSMHLGSLLAQETVPQGARRSRSGRSPSRFRPSVLINAAALAAAILLAFLLWPRSSATDLAADPAADLSESRTIIRSASAGTQIHRLGASLPASPGLALEVDDAVVAATDGGAALEFADGSLVRLQAASSLAVLGDDGGTRLDLRLGVVDCDIAAQAPGTTFSIRTRFALATVLGTQFQLSALDDSTTLEVGSGRVALSSADGSQRLVAGAGERLLADAAGVHRLGANGLAGIAGRLPPDAPLVAWWPLDDRVGNVARDLVSDHLGRIRNPVWDADGLLAFDGRDTSIVIEPTGQLATLEQRAYSILCSFQAESYRAPGLVTPTDSLNYQFLVGRQGFAMGLMFTHEGVFLAKHFLSNDVPITASSNGQALLGRWYQLAMVVDPELRTCSIYVDGALHATQPWPPGLSTRDYGTSPWCIGLQHAGGGGMHWPAHGRIRDVMLVATALGADDIAAVHATPAQ